ncbi:MAG: BMP family ABC transporter substrate-binding protein [Lachnospiraceae bacterium]|nr:BMP family ABC transporter substrate-binding protein [Lachnospiraceae bacterium]
MKKVLAMLLVTSMAISLAACGSSSSSTSTTTETSEDSEESSESTGETYKAALLLNGTLGDKSFYDSANEGLTTLEEELGSDVFTFKVEQMGGEASDESKWEPTLLDYCDSGEWDVIIIGTWQMGDALANAAEQYPDQKFMYFDEQYDFDENGNYGNIYNILYKQNEVSYLVGAAAAMLTTTEGIDGIDASTKLIGLIGGMDNAVINDFIVGYTQGATDIDPEIEIVTSFVGDFTDSAKGKELALAQFNSGVDVAFNVAGNAGLGLIEAAAETGHYAFGVDSDQAALLSDYADYIPTSALKNVGNSLILAIKADMEGTLEYGITAIMGFAEGGVELVKDDHYEEMLPQEIRDTLDELEQQIIDGEIVVDTTIEIE